MYADDATRVRHMLDAARELEEYTSTYTDRRSASAMRASKSSPMAINLPQLTNR
jgi:hypothetical protein